MRYGNPWEFQDRAPLPCAICREVDNSSGRKKIGTDWIGGEEVMAMAYDYPVPGFKNETVNTLRLWAAKSIREFNHKFFNDGDYMKAVEERFSSENIFKGTLSKRSV